MYLLKIKKKFEESAKIQITMYCDYLEFTNLTQLIKYIFNNANFLESYEIFERRNFEQSNDSSLYTIKGCNEGNLRIKA